MTMDVGTLVNDLLLFLDDHRWFVATVVTAYLYATYWYCRMWLKTRNSILVAPISLKGGISKARDGILLAPIFVGGGISEKVGAREVGLLLRTHLSAITGTFQKATQSREYLYAAQTPIMDFETMDAALLEVEELKAAEVIPDLLGIASGLQLKEDLVIRAGPVQIPVGAIANLVQLLIRWLPVPYRERYLASLIHLSLVSTDDETQLLVYREGQRTVSFGRIARVKNLTDLSDLLRDAAFMILRLHGKVMKARNWLGMRCFADGLDAIDEYRLTAKQQLLDKAKKAFGRAAEDDPDNVHALYFYGCMLLVERRGESIATATKLFTRALKLGKLLKGEKRKLNALVHTGLANCYAQQFHRLAKRKTEILEAARLHAEEARREWQEATRSKHLHQWILSTLALAGVVDEGTSETREEAKKRFLTSAPFLVQAIETEPENGKFHNNLGWLLLKLAEWKLPDIETLSLNKEVPPDFSKSPALAAEYYLLRALELNPKNKLSHANLCLLFATPHYRKHPKEEEECNKNLIRCRYHGLKAIQLDPQYINGHRDLALSLLRYNQFDEAYGYFEDALRLAATVEKDQEIIADALSVLEEIQVSEKKEWERWRHPDLSLLVPPDRNHDCS